MTTTEPTDKELAAEIVKRQGQARARLEMYRSSEAAYFGERAGENGNVRSMDGQGRPILRFQTTRNELASRPGAPNLILPIVDDLVAVVGRVPQMRVLPWEDEDKIKPELVKLSRVLRSQWLQSNMLRQNAEGAWYMVVKSEALYTLTAIVPEQAKERDMPAGMYITVVDPALCFPRFGAGWDRHVLEDVIVREEVDAFTARRQWGVRTSDEEEHIEVLHYIGRNQNRVLAKGKTVAEVTHNLGFCPAEWVSMRSMRRHGHSDIYQVIDLHAELQIMQGVMNDTLIEATYSQLVITDPASTDERFEVGPGAEPIVVNPGGKVERLQPGNPPHAAAMILGNSTDQLQRMTGMAAIRTTGAIDHSNISGRAIAGSQGPMEERLTQRQELLGSHYERLNSMIMRAFFRIPELRDGEMTVHGVESSGKPYVETFTGADFMGWDKNAVRFGSTLGRNSHETSVVVLNLHDKHLVDGVFVLENLDVPDPERMIARARAEMKEEMALMQGGQPPSPQPGPPPQAPPGQGGGAPPGAEPAQPGPPGAAPPGGAPPGMPPFPPVDTAPTQPGMGTPSAMPDMGRMLETAAKAVQPQLNGRIARARPVPGGVMVTVSFEPGARIGDKNHDRALIRQAYHAAGFADVKIEEAHDDQAA